MPSASPRTAARAGTPSIDFPDRYAGVRHVANGGMAGVWSAEDRVLGRRVAIKLLSGHFAADEVAMRRFDREARTAAGLSWHPHVVTIYDVGEADDRPFIVMEYLSGGSVADALREHRITHEQALDWLHQAADALDTAHAGGIVHRDIKPGNLLFDERGRLVIADFGIARLAHDTTATSTGQVLGTAAYISPEQAAGERATPASDRYALAVVAFELLTGTRPFLATNETAVAREHVEADPPSPSDLAPDLDHAVDRVLKRGLAKRPARRWPSAIDFVTALEDALAGSSPAGPRLFPVPAPAAAPVRGKDLRRRRGVAFAALAVSLAAALIVLLLAAGGGGRQARSPSARAPAPSKPPRAAPGPSAKARASAPSPAAPGPAATRDPAALNGEGFRLMQEGRYGAAVPPLRGAVEGACPSSGADLTCAYALYNLGRSLRLSGQPAAAIPYLERRLQFANQREVVARELALARDAAGLHAAPAPAVAGPQPGGAQKHEGRGKPGKRGGRGPDGGGEGGD
ncbi:MAG: eukaryotic-like serine/threonine-protein kinase [Solirubrobacteraceae bacterium]|jgi:serine/threonine-protein kinase|nr:eukaryotic-like serine/threonine-protein kinase [Solirubrobacteraceae bacterium]